MDNIISFFIGKSKRDNHSVAPIIPASFFNFAKTIFISFLPLNVAFCSVKLSSSLGTNISL